MQPAADLEEASESAPTEGHSVPFMINPDGTFTVDGESVDNLSDALKHVIACVKEYQSGTTEQASMEAGYGQPA